MANMHKGIQIITTESLALALALALYSTQIEAF